MKNRIKKYVGLVLALTFLLGLGASAFAMEEARAGGCTVHTWDRTRTYLQEIKGSSTGCVYIYAEARVCSICGREEVIGTFSETLRHEFSPYDSSCNGYTQTWRVRCENCGYYSREEHSCPNAPHVGKPCNMLPCSIGLETQ